jgi:4'-phosphopantetheinyl transferase
LQADLSDSERQRAENYVTERARRGFIVTRANLRAILAAYLDRPSRSLVFDRAERGKLFLRCDSLRFNVSHSGELALIAVSGARELGVDLEMLRPVHCLREVADRLWSPADVAALTCQPQVARDEAFLAMWTRKEAAAKALGVGIGVEMRAMALPVQAQPVSALVRLPSPEADGQDWTLIDVRPARGYFGSLVCAGRSVAWRGLHWPPHRGSELN